MARRELGPSMTVAVPSGSTSWLRSIRWRTVLDRLLVGIIILGAWQLGTVIVGNYWLSSPWATLSRFAAQLMNGELIFHASYTLGEAAAGTLIGGVPAVLLPFLLRRHPIVVAILDPFMIGGYGAPKTCLRALVHSVVRHRHRIQDCACRESRFLHRLFRHAQRRARARCKARADGADHRRQRAPGLASHRSPERRAFDLRWFSHRGPLLRRRRRNRRADLVQPRAWLSGADRSDEFRHHQRVRGHRNGDAPGARRQLAHEFARDAAAALAAADRSDHGNVTMAGAALLEIRKLGKRFAQRHGREPSPWVIQDLSFSVREGEFLTIVGPSGAGKSTLLNIIAQIDTTSAGEIVFDGRNVTTRDPRALRPGCNRRIGYVTQEDNLLPWRSTLHNVLFALEVQGRLNDETRARAEMLIRAVGLAGYEHYYPHELSGGMRKRTALIRTLVYDPPVILMDEPFASVDAQTRTQLQADLLKLWDLGRKTIIFVTHDITEAIALGDRALVLSRQPSRIAAEHIIPIPRPRNIKDIFALEGFAATYEKIRADVQ